jgi:polyphosphate kinase 2
MAIKLSDYEKVEGYPCVYVSKDAIPNQGKKYLCRFQHNGKKHLKILGTTKKDKMTHKRAYDKYISYKKELDDNTQTTTKQSPSNDTKIKIKDQYITLEDLIEKFQQKHDILGDDYLSKVKSHEELKRGIQKIYDLHEMKPYQIELIKLQKHLEANKKKMIILFEGRDASGKGGAIRRMTRYMNNKHYRIVALGKPTDTQRHQWFFQKYVEHFPTAGEVVLFDRSWYNRAMVEPIFGFCTEEEYEIFMEDVVNFEHDLVRQNLILVKLYFSVSKEEQKRRFDSRASDPLKQWKLSEVDLQAQDLWEEFSKKKYEMLRRTHSRHAPWHILRSDDKYLARLEAIKVILNSVNYDNRNTSLNYDSNNKIYVSVQKELAQMRKDDNSY